MPESYLPGYEPNSYPSAVSIDHAEHLVALLRSQKFTLIGSCVTSESTNVHGMLRTIEGARRYDSPSSVAVPGPLVINGKIITGSALGLWEQFLSN